MMAISSYDVIIAGAGPVGLLLACELGLANVSVLVLERETSASSQWKDGSLGRRGLFLPAVEALHRRGLLDQVTQTKASERQVRFEKTDKFQFAGHFAGMMLDGNNVDFSRWKYHLPGPAAMPGVTTLGHMESVLAERAQQLGVCISRGTAISKFVDEGEDVKVWAGEGCFSSKWLVGCDGGRSFVRKAAGFDFVGTEAEFTGYAAVCDLDKPELLAPGFVKTRSGMYISIGSGALYVIDFDLAFDRTQPITREHFQDVLQRVSGTNVQVNSLHLASSFTDRSKQASQYRKGRVLLAGDSAHIHSPLGAQGLNTGIGDAINLGWKLAATVNGTAPDGLLDTYHAERHPVAALVLEWTRAQVTTLRPDGYGTAVSNLVRDLINTPDGTSYFVDRIWGLSQRYDLGGSHPLVGCSCPDFHFEDGSRLGELLESGRPLLLDLENNTALTPFACWLNPSVTYCASPAAETFGLKALLVRPDGIVVWAAEEEVDIDALKAAMARWIGGNELKA